MRRLLELLLVTGAALGLAAGLVLWTNPIGVGRWWNRLRLQQAGFAHRFVEGPRGPLSLFEGGSADGPPVVLVHGMGDQAGTWARVVPGLVAGYRLVLVDLPGHGESAPAEGSLTMDDELAGLVAVVDQVAAGTPVTLVGNSFGGWLALLYAEARPERVARLVLLDSAGLRAAPEEVALILPRDREQARRLAFAVVGDVARQMPAFLLDDLVDEVADGPTPRLWESISAEADRFLLDDRLGEVCVPVDVVWGTEDGLLGLDHAYRFEAGLPVARLHLLEGCAHAPQHTCAGMLTGLLREILARSPPVLGLEDGACAPEVRRSPPAGR